MSILKIFKLIITSVLIGGLSFHTVAQCPAPTLTFTDPNNNIINPFSGCTGTYKVTATVASSPTSTGFTWTGMPAGGTTTFNLVGSTWVGTYTGTFNAFGSYSVRNVCATGPPSSAVSFNFNLFTNLAISTSPADPMSLAPGSSATLTANNGLNFNWRYGSTGGPVIGTGSSYVATNGGIYYLTGQACGVQTVSTSVNHLPGADAGLDQTISMPTSYTVNGSAYDSDDGDNLTVSWSKVSGPTVTMQNTTTTALLLTNILSGTYTFRLTVTDSHSKTSTDDVVIAASSITNNYNYLKEDKVLVDSTTTSGQVQSLPLGSKITTFGYQDDLGRAVEKVQVQGSPALNDLVSFKIYDGLGREPIGYLPFVNSSTSGNFVTVATAQTTEQTFYNTTNDQVADDATPSAQRVFELSPLGRVTQQGSFGSAWQPGVGAKTFSYAFGGSGILQWTINSGLPQILSPGNTLTKKTMTDEQGVSTEVYSTLEGVKVLSRTDAGGGVWAETYYVYDQLNNLKFTLPPELIKVVKANNATTVTQIQLDRWAFQYNYDILNRLVEFKAPGAGWVYSIYDARNRVVLTQDANQRNGDASQSIPANKWSYTKYDEQNRPVIAGIYGPDNTYTTRAAMQTYVDGLVSGQGYQNISTTVSGGMKSGMEFVISAYEGINEYRAITSITLKPGFDFIGGTTGTSFRVSIDNGSGTDGAPADIFPVANDEALSVTYYDTYTNCNICADPSYQFVLENWTPTRNTEPFSSYSRIKGSTVASTVKILNTNTWLNTVSYYNRHGQPIQVIGKNHLGGLDRVSTYVDFSGRKLEELQTAIGYNSGGISTMRKVFAYDPNNRLLLTVKHQINSQPTITLSAFTYNKIGQVVAKQLHSTDGTTYLQKIDYRYNIRNWLTNINNIPTVNDTGDDANDYFGMDLTYNGTLSGIGATNTPRKDGFINDIRWKQDLGSKRRVYNFTYDNLGRVTSSNQKMSPDNSVTWTGEADFYTETGLTYDLNGNILSLNRNTEYFSSGSNSASAMDQLSYVYGPNTPSASDNGNQLQYVKENSTAATNTSGFKDGGANTIASPDYTYDANGSLITDQNKGIAGMTYYFNKLPNKVTLTDGSYLQNTYDAAGIKLSQSYYAMVSGVLQPAVVTDYVGSIVLLNGQVLTVNHSEGRITAPTYANMLSNSDAGSTDGYTASQNVTLATSFTNGQTYVSGVCNQSTSTPGIFPINTTKGTSIPVKQGESYTFKVLGYQSVGTSASLYVKTNSGDLIWPGVALPVGSANENWVTASFTVPSGVTSVQFGVLWSSPAIGNAFYINRVAVYKTDFEYNYYITDQVGSTRVVLQTNPGTQVYTATMESQNQPNENSMFQNMSGSAINQMVASPGNHTPGGSYAYKLNGAFSVGPAKSIKVYPGDKIDASAFSFFVNTTGYNSALASVAGNVASIFGGVPGAGEAGSIYQNVTNAYASGGVLAGHTGNTTYPSAYLNYILFDKDYNPIQGQSYPISQTANSIQPVSITQVTASELGYFYVYLSYENTNTNAGAEVYFDDFKITLQESAVIQVNNFYPFGMQAYTWLRSGETDNAYLFQGKELIAQTGWHDFGSRMYYGDLGRWFATDPQNQFASPYLAMGNMPMIGRDPDGEFYIVDDIIVAAVGFVVGYFSYALTKHDWGIKAVESGGIGAVIAEAGYLTLGGGLAASADIEGSAAIKGATQFAILDATTTSTSVAENSDKISNMKSDNGALEAIAGIEGVSALQAGFQTDYAENQVDKILYGSKGAGWFGKGVTSDAIGGLFGGGIQAGQGGLKWDWGGALVNSAGAAASKAAGNIFDKTSQVINGKNSYLRDYKGLPPPSDVLNYSDQGATVYREQVVRNMDKRLLAGKEVVSVLFGQWATNRVKNWYGRDQDDYWKDTNKANIGSGALKDGLSLFWGN